MRKRSLASPSGAKNDQSGETSPLATAWFTQMIRRSAFGASSSICRQLHSADSCLPGLRRLILLRFVLPVMAAGSHIVQMGAAEDDKLWLYFL
jgi:uncharacterized membrane protein